MWVGKQLLLHCGLAHCKFSISNCWWGVEEKPTAARSSGWNTDLLQLLLNTVLLRSHRAYERTDLAWQILTTRAMLTMDDVYSSFQAHPLLCDCCIPTAGQGDTPLTVTKPVPYSFHAAAVYCWYLCIWKEKAAANVLSLSSEIWWDSQAWQTHIDLKTSSKLPCI